MRIYLLLVLLCLSVSGCFRSQLERDLQLLTIRQSSDIKTVGSPIQVIFKSGNMYSHGSGSFVHYKDDVLFLTACHVFAPEGFVSLKTREGLAVTVRLSLLYGNTDTDVLVCKVLDPLPDSVTVAPVRFHYLTGLATVTGYPEGKLSQHIGKILSNAYYIHGMSVGGMSGAGVYVDGEIVGVLSASRSDNVSIVAALDEAWFMGEGQGNNGYRIGTIFHPFENSYSTESKDARTGED